MAGGAVQLVKKASMVVLALEVVALNGSYVLLSKRWLVGPPVDQSSGTVSWDLTNLGPYKCPSCRGAKLPLDLRSRKELTYTFMLVMIR